ncbi:MAG: hypothetical protein GXP48_05105 [Acidobacteria bacterium]|nr:hypothetical protein [Acidobacteriota bacterium]
MSPMQQAVTVSPGETMKLGDVFQDLFGLSQAVGALRFQSTRKVVVAARSYNLTSAGLADSQGQFVAGMPSELAIGSGQKTSIPGITQPADGSFRSNFAMVETAGGTANVQVTLYDRDGVPVATKTYTLSPYEPKQVSLHSFSSSATVDGGRMDIKVLSGSGKVLTFASMVGNGTVSQDPSTLEMEYELTQGSGSGLTQVAHDSTLSGDGTSSSPLGIANGGVTSAALADSSVSSAKIANGAVTTAKISSSGASNGQVLKFNGSSVGWAADASGLTLPWSTQISSQTVAMNVENAKGVALSGHTAAAGVAAVSGLTSNASNGSFGVVGIGRYGGVEGLATLTSGWANGVRGVNRSNDGAGVYGISSGSSGTTYGVYGKTTSTSGGAAGVRGETGTAGADVYGVFGSSDSPYGVGVAGRAPYGGIEGEATSTSGDTIGIWGIANSPDGTGVWGTNNSTGSGAMGIVGETGGNSGWASGVRGVADGNAAIGTTGWNLGSGPGLYAWSETGNALIVKGAGTGDLAEIYDHSAGQLRWKVTHTGDVYADGSFHPNGADFAEMVPVRESGIEPGDVVALAIDGTLVKTTRPYQAAVVGVVSTKPGYQSDLYTDVPTGTKAALAVIGIVPVKATAANGPIRPGDMLTSSDIPGRAMAATHVRAGTIIGKAMEGLASGEGTIRMLVMLR